ncbi:hypothetical protein H632_c119p0 [Helicosporidium sp. ATCC 50920]|nr:hypothetical protein H632_c119p0 [Helicosporidium sp. ATCC 50920]|eukprot:KDD76747.1 hypothetical protein H632_c119p0 [Helicosporidium sp. ATCC 50920]
MSPPQNLQVALDWDLPHALCQSAVTEERDGSDKTSPADLSARREALPFMYIMHTSGSTGSPVSVHGTEEGLLSLAEWMARSPAWPEALPNDCWALRTRPAAVDSVWECLGVLLCGYSGAILLDSKTRTRAEAAGAMLADAHALGVTHMSATPAEWQAALGGAASVPDRSLRVAVSSGESLSARLAARLAEKALAPRADSRVVNLYGCTEAAGDSTWCIFSRELALAGRVSGSVPAGRPVDCAGVAVAQLADEADRRAEPRLDSRGRAKLLPRGERGAVLLFGEGLARCDVPESPLAVVRAVAEEVKRHGVVGSRVLRDERHEEVACVCPGDLGYLTDRGELVVCGRLARAPPKLGGVRVDLEEVRAALEELSGVEQAAVKVWTTPAGRSLLAAYVAAPGERDDIESSADESTTNAWTASARKQLAERLPRQAVPRIIVHLPDLPLTPGGKICACAPKWFSPTPPSELSRARRGQQTAGCAKQRRIRVHPCEQRGL